MWQGTQQEKEGKPNADASVLVMQGKAAFYAELSIGVGNNKRENIDKGRDCNETINSWRNHDINGKTENAVWLLFNEWHGGSDAA
jgi:hypothetical protein